MGYPITASSIMTNKTWVIQKILDLYPQTPELEVYIHAIQRKIERINFLSERLAPLDKLSPTSVSNGLHNSFIETAIYIESIASNLHSLADVIANIINVIVLAPLGKDVPVDTVTIKAVNKKLSELTAQQQNQYLNKIISEVDNLLSLSEFIYIEAFVNTIKHRNLVPSTLEYKKTPDSTTSGYILDGFSYKSITCPPTKFEDIAKNHKDRITGAIFDIGDSINNYSLSLNTNIK
jgi:hypothetical protein